MPQLPPLTEADGIAIILRVPSGWLVDRIRAVVLVAIGLVATSLAVVLLAQTRRRQFWSSRAC